MVLQTSKTKSRYNLRGDNGMKTELETAIIQMGKILQHPEETIDNFDDETLINLSNVLMLEVEKRVNRSIQ